MSTTIANTKSGGADVKNTPAKPDIPLSPAALAFVKTVALQRNEWVELQSVRGLRVQLDNYRDPSNGRVALLVAFISESDDFRGDNTHGRIFVNDVDIDELLVQVVEAAKAEKEGQKDEQTQEWVDWGYF